MQRFIQGTTLIMDQIGCYPKQNWGLYHSYTILKAGANSIISCQHPGLLVELLIMCE